MSKSKLSFTRNTVVKGVLSEDATYVTYTDENETEQDVLVCDLLNAFKNQPIEFTVQLKGTEELDIIPSDDLE